ncbi:unnamed protein product [Cercospora beticola]|nr:unnamed protein product [Cercospora beticola]
MNPGETGLHRVYSIARTIPHSPDLDRQWQESARKGRETGDESGNRLKRCNVPQKDECSLHVSLINSQNRSLAIRHAARHTTKNKAREALSLQTLQFVKHGTAW